jgi:hypothetical protein
LKQAESGFQFSLKPNNYLDFFFKGACDKAEAAVDLAAFVALGFFICFEATFATGSLVCFGLRGIKTLFLGKTRIKKSSINRFVSWQYVGLWRRSIV